MRDNLKQEMLNSGLLLETFSSETEKNKLLIFITEWLPQHWSALAGGFNPGSKDSKAEFMLKMIFLLVLKINHTAKQTVKNNSNVPLNPLTDSADSDKTSS